MSESLAETANALIACIGCGGRVPDVQGPIHRYMTAAPGCWQAYTGLLGGGLPPSPAASLCVDAYAVTHPGVPGPQATPSVWVHLMTLCFVLERRWPVDQAISLRRAAAEAFSDWPWLEPPGSMGEVSAIDLSRALAAGDGPRAIDLTRRWVDGAWAAWDRHHPVVRARTDWLARKLA